MAGHSRQDRQGADDELVSALFEISKARTLLLGVTEALPAQLQMYGSDIEQLLDRATARLRWLHVESSSPPGPDAEPTVVRPRPAPD